MHYKSLFKFYTMLRDTRVLVPEDIVPVTTMMGGMGTKHTFNIKAQGLGMGVSDDNVRSKNNCSSARAIWIFTYTNPHRRNNSIGESTFFVSISIRILALIIIV
jgi:hypothetical protein